jgi:3-deoxy-manno-octulosonate cytidylyltransferase (CMP-KDO synthetase)
MNYIVVIPARLVSTRLPEKPLIKIKGKTVIQRTFEQCLKAVPEKHVYIATDSLKIKEHVESFTSNVLLTSSDCLTGTDRIAEVAKKIEVDYYINVQGDEPLINPSDIKKVIKNVEFDSNISSVYNGYSEIKDESEYRSLTIPKVVMREDGRLLYMSRSPIPGNKIDKFQKSWKQICIYGFSRKSLLDFSNRSKKTELEEQEDIEILRFLEMGYEVQMIKLKGDSIAVDTPEDVERVKLALEND